MQRILDRLMLAALFALVGGCGKKDGSGKESPTPPPVTAASTPAPEPAATAPTPVAPTAGATATGKTIEEDLDGDGSKDKVTITRDRLTVNAAEIPLTIFEAKPDQASCSFTAEEGDDSTEFEVKTVDIDRADKHRELLISCYVDEDAYLVSIFSYADGTIVESMLYSPPEFPGDGTYKSQEQNWDKKVLIETSYRWKDRKLVMEKERVVRKLKEDERMACPFVYVETAAGLERQGEILRHLNHRGLEATQSLALPAAMIEGGRLRVRLAEEKPETTYLDDVYLRIDGEEIRPLDCDGGRGHCRVDQAYTTLRRGQVLDLVFEIGDRRPRTVELWATGYYVPDHAPR
jgi:hypothetical protein